MNVRALVEMAIVAIGYAVAPVIMSRRLSHLASIPVIVVSLLGTALAYAPYALTHWPTSVSAGGGLVRARVWAWCAPPWRSCCSSP